MASRVTAMKNLRHAKYKMTYLGVLRCFLGIASEVDAHDTRCDRGQAPLCQVYKASVEVAVLLFGRKGVSESVIQTRKPAPGAACLEPLPTRPAPAALRRRDKWVRNGKNFPRGGSAGTWAGCTGCCALRFAHKTLLQSIAKRPSHAHIVDTKPSKKDSDARGSTLQPSVQGAASHACVDNFAQPSPPPPHCRDPSTTSTPDLTATSDTAAPINCFMPSPPLSHSVSSEWQHLQYASPPPEPPALGAASFPVALPVARGAAASPLTPPPDSPLHPYSLYAVWRSTAPAPGSSPSPCPSLSSSTSSSQYSHTIAETEELDCDNDSGIEIMNGEFEYAPGDYDRAPSPCSSTSSSASFSSSSSSDSDCSDDDVEHQDGCIDHARPRRRPAANTSGRAGAAHKRTHLESLDRADDDVACNSDSSSDDVRGSRVRRRKIAHPRSGGTRRDAENNTGTAERMMDEMEL